MWQILGTSLPCPGLGPACPPHAHLFREGVPSRGMAKSKGPAAAGKKVWADSEQTGSTGWKEVQSGSEIRVSPRKALNVRLVWIVMDASLPGLSATGQFPGQRWPGACELPG